MGSYVDTLSVSAEVPGPWLDLELAPERFREREPLRCCLVGDLVLCKGLALGLFPRELRLCGGEGAIARLPEGMRPLLPLTFAAFLRDGGGLGGRPMSEPKAVPVAVMPDGWIHVSGIAESKGVIDLSAIRFSTGRGVALVDDVRLHVCELSSRHVVLQGSLAERCFGDRGSDAPGGIGARLALLPLACRPRREFRFIGAGMGRAPASHLVIVRPLDFSGFGGEVVWGDSVWEAYDKISLSGILYEVAPEVLHVSFGAATWSAVRRQITVLSFQKQLISKYGTVEYAWSIFAPDSSGRINFTKFSLGCKAAAYVGDVSKLWAMLDEDGSGEISSEEFAVHLSMP